MNYPYYGGYMPQYQPQQMQPTQMSVANAQKPSEERIWVQSEAQAEAYLVSPGSFVRLWHISEPIFYEKSCDAAGRPTPMAAYRYEKIANEPVFTANGTTVLEQKFRALDGRISALESMMGKENNNAEHDDESNAAERAD